MAEKDLYLKIGRPNNACAMCGEPITHAGKHPSILLPKGTPTPSTESKSASAPAADPAQSASSDELPGLPPIHNAADDGPRREDYCVDCWKDVGDKDYLGYWLARREPPKTRKIESRKERNAGILAWFDLLRTQKPDEENLQAQYFLAHLLMKYGVLKWIRTETDPDGAETIYFRQTGTEDDVAVAAVDLTDERSLEIKRQLDEYLQQYANATPTDAASASSTADT